MLVNNDKTSLNVDFYYLASTNFFDNATPSRTISTPSSVSVVAPTCAQSSARATALFVLGPDAGFALAVRERWSALFLIREGPSFTAHPTPEFTRLAR